MSEWDILRRNLKCMLDDDIKRHQQLNTLRHLLIRVMSMHCAGDAVGIEAALQEIADTDATIKSFWDKFKNP